jgi:acyl-ACP thioesterase
MDEYVDSMVDIVFDKNQYDVSDADFEFDRVIRYSDLDMNMHTNNVIYSRIIMDTFDTTYLSQNTLSEFQIDYINQSKEGDTISVSQKKVSDGFYYIIGNVADKCIFRAYVRFE